MVQALEQRVSLSSWWASLRSLSPWFAGICVMVALLVVYFAVEFGTGRISRLLAGEPQGAVGCDWLVGDYRISVVGIVLLSYVVAAQTYLERWTALNLDRVRSESDAPGRAPTRRRKRSRLLAGFIGMAITLAVAGDISERPIDSSATYWIWPHFFNWLWAVVFGWFGGRFLYSIVASCRDVSKEAQSLRRVRLFDRSLAAACVRQGTESAFLLLVFVGLVSVHFADPGTGAIASVVVFSLLAIASGVSLVPMFGHRNVIGSAKRDTLRPIHARLEEIAIKVRQGQLDQGRGGDEIRDLLAMEARVETVREWPLSLSGALRLALYVTLGLGSWLGAAMVERLLDGWLG